MLKGTSVAFNSTTMFFDVSDESLLDLLGTASNHVTVYLEYPTTDDSIPEIQYALIQQLINAYANKIAQPVTLKIERVYARVY